MTTVFRATKSARRALAAALMVFFSSACMVSRPVNTRPEGWATPVPVEGVPNLFRVTDNLYRSAQPTGEGFLNLAKMGIRTVINLSANSSDRKLVKGTGLSLVEIPIPNIRPTGPQVIQLIKITTDKTRCPVLVHCRYGADRTGAMIAAYRVGVEGWSKEETIKEMTGGGYGYHVIWTNLISFVRNLGVEEVRAALSDALHGPKPEIEGASP